MVEAFVSWAGKLSGRFCYRVIILAVLKVHLFRDEY